MRFADTHCRYEERVINGQHFYLFTGHCVITNKNYTVKVPAQELYNYRQRQYIQTALKSVSAEDREFLMTGYSPEGWKQVFYDEEEEDDCFDA